MNPKPRIQKAWKIAPVIPAEISQALQNFSPFLRQLLYNRGIKDRDAGFAYIAREVATNTDPFQLQDMQTAVDLIHRTLKTGGKIAVYGDYDVDGVTATSLLFEFFTALGASARAYIPSRAEEGYGLHVEAMDQLASEGTCLIITVDCGIRSAREVTHARELGMDVIVTDHHEPDVKLPPANAVINAHRKDETYPFKEFAGVGIAYKLVQAYLQQFPFEGVNAEDWLDLVAIGTVADLVSLSGENRSLVYKGLQKARQLTRQGLYSLCRISNIRLETLNAIDIAFKIGPRLNASGRLESALAAFNLLTSRDIRQAGELAQKLDSQNKDRQDITEAVITQTLASPLLQDPDIHVIFVYSPDFNEGVVGIAASKVVEATYKPTLIGYDAETLVKASCRSIEGFDINAALDKCDDLLIRHGGHAAAAGFSIQKANIPEFIERMNKIALEIIGEPWPTPSLKIDMAINLEALTAQDLPEVFKAMELLEPTGRGNSDALFCSLGCPISNVNATKDGKHLRFHVKAGQVDFPAIAFGMGNLAGNLPARVDLAYTFSENEYMGRRETQLLVKDIKY
ncbi:MAG TPA: single-stranded-DNA-specific exonuclease RecJ [Anaerolineaceae bacterium]|nr:single-stranded-DNA-specific exonuclease RecJ [Anaerolineaceae bacterium]